MTEKRAVLEGHSSLIASLTVSSDHKHIVSGSSGHTVRVWNVKEKRAVLEGHTFRVNSITISSDDKYILDPMIKL
jgi:WD40 repeat protein